MTVAPNETAPAAGPPHALSDRPASVPVIDISRFTGGTAEERRAVVDEVDAACRALGFFVITGHRVPDALVERVRTASRAFYDLPDDKKAQYSSARRGYFGKGRQRVGQSMGKDIVTPPDNHEIFAMGRDVDDGDPYFQTPLARKAFFPNVWPDDAVPDFRPAWLDYVAELERVARVLMEIFELALKLPEKFFWKRFDRHMSNMAAINYPAPTGEALPNQRRLGAHTDFGAFTILKAENKPGSLEVQTRDGTWEPVPILEDGYIVNVGDLLKRWTNDVWESSFHQVTNPPSGSGRNSRRQSLVFFMHPNYDAVIEPIPGCGDDPAKYPPILAGELITSRLDRIREGGKTM